MIKSHIKFFIFFAILFQSLISLSSHKESSNTILSILIHGNKKVSTNTIEHYIQIKIGDEFTELKSNDIIKNLYNTKMFKNISTDFNKGNLIITVDELPVIHEISIKGNNSIKTSSLKKLITIGKGEFIDEDKILTSVKKIKSKYKQEKQFLAKVNFELKKIKNNQVEIIFQISEQKTTKIKDIVFVGNTIFSDKKLRSIITNKRLTFFKSLSGKSTFIQDMIELDKELLKEFYLSSGFIDFKINSVLIKYNDDFTRCTLIYNLEEGNKYYIGDVTFENNAKEIINDKEINKLISFNRNKIFNNKDLIKFISKITQIHNKYYNIYVEPHIERIQYSRTVNINFIINKNLKPTINNININGNLKTEDKIIRHNINLEEGGLLSNNMINKSIRNLNNLDYFNKVHITSDQSKFNNRRDINIFLQEKSTAGLSLELGKDSNKGFFSKLMLSENNILGTAKTLSTFVEATRTSLDYDILFTQPYFFNDYVTLSWHFFTGNSNINTRYNKNYASSLVGFNNALSFNLFEDFSYSIGYGIKRDKIRNIPKNSSEFLQNQLGSFITSEISNQFVYDKTDNKLNPKSGYVFSAAQTIAGIGGNNKYIMHEISAKYYRSFYKNMVTFKLSGELGNIRSLSCKYGVRVMNRFTLGGDQRLRGFIVGGIGPRDKKTLEAFGGEKYYFSTAELYFPITFKHGNPNITGVIFSDIGNTWGLKLVPKNKSFLSKFYHNDSFRQSIGCGMVINTEMTPIRIDVAFPIKKKIYDEKQYLHISFSTNF